MATLKELRDERLRKLEDLKKLGIDPYPAHVKRTNRLTDVVKDFKKLENKPVSVTGRVLSIRKIGKIAFIVIRDESDKVQLFLKSDQFKKTDVKNSELGFEQINLLDRGDFVQASGNVIKSQTGEISIAVENLDC